jgi:hypothetical protein
MGSCIVLATLIAVLLQIPVFQKQAFPVLYSEQDYAAVMVSAAIKVLQNPKADVEKGLRHFDGVTPRSISGRNTIIGFETLGGMGWPEIPAVMNITFVRADGSRSETYHYDIVTGQPRRI